MGLNTARFFSFLFVALVLAPAMAHLLELPNKIGLSREDYLIVQNLPWLGVTGHCRRRGAAVDAGSGDHGPPPAPRVFALTLAAFLCALAAHVVFWIFTFPTNRETSNWTVLPENWMTLRAQWEYSHAAGAVLNLVVFIMLVLSVLVRSK